MHAIRYEETASRERVRETGTPEIHERHLGMEVHPSMKFGTVRISDAAEKRLSGQAGIFGATNSV
jgi:hypothetical protein